MRHMPTPRRRFTSVIACIGGLCSLATSADSCVSLQGDAVQGGLLWGQALTATEIRFADQSVPILPGGYFIVGLGRDMPAANGNQTAGDATSFSNYNTGLIDRVMPVKTNEGSEDSENDSKQKKSEANIVKIAKMINTMTTAGGFWDAISGGAGGVWEDVMRDREWLSEDLATFNSNHTQKCMCGCICGRIHHVTM